MNRPLSSAARGDRGAAGKPAPKQSSIIGWKVDHAHYRIVPFQSDGQPGPQAIELRPMFARFLDEIGLQRIVREAVREAMRTNAMQPW